MICTNFDPLGNIELPTNRQQRKSYVTAKNWWGVVKSIAVAFTLTLEYPSILHAQSLVLGAGYTRFSYDGAHDNPMFSLELQYKPFHSAGRWKFGLAGALSVDTLLDVHVGFGLLAIYNVRNQWFIETSVMPGIYFNGSEGNWLGGHFQIRSLLGVGYTMDERHSLSLAITHMSNASTTDFNPGMNAILLRWHRRF